MTPRRIFQVTVVGNHGNPRILLVPARNLIEAITMAEARAQRDTAGPVWATSATDLGKLDVKAGRRKKDRS